MGIDVEMFAEVARSENLTAICEEFNQTFGFLDEKYANGLQICTTEPFYEFARRAGDWAVLQLNTLSRYYGVGYECGPIIDIIAWAEFIEERFDDARVFYGGDSGDSLGVFDADERLRLKRWFFWNGERPYRSGWGDTERIAPVTPPVTATRATADSEATHDPSGEAQRSPVTKSSDQSTPCDCAEVVLDNGYCSGCGAQPGMVSEKVIGVRHDER